MLVDAVVKGDISLVSANPTRRDLSGSVIYQQATAIRAAAATIASAPVAPPPVIVRSQPVTLPVPPALRVEENQNALPSPSSPSVLPQRDQAAAVNEPSVNTPSSSPPGSIAAPAPGVTPVPGVAGPGVSLGSRAGPTIAPARAEGSSPLGLNANGIGGTVSFQIDQAEEAEASDGTVVIVIRNGGSITRSADNGDFLDNATADGGHHGHSSPPVPGPRHLTVMATIRSGIVDKTLKNKNVPQRTFFSRRLSAGFTGITHGAPFFVNRAWPLNLS